MVRWECMSVKRRPVSGNTANGALDAISQSAPGGPEPGFGATGEAEQLVSAPAVGRNWRCYRETEGRAPEIRRR